MDAEEKKDKQQVLVAAEFTIEQAEEFFEIVKELGIDNNPKAKSDLLIEFIQNGKAVRAWKTHRSKEQFVKDMRKNYGSVEEA